MMNRRKFVSALGASTFLPATQALTLATSPKAPATGRARVSLGGEWQRYIGSELYDTVPVPSSQHPLGLYHLKRGFLLPRLSPSERAVLHFDGITYFGRPSVNGAELGSMSLYVPYEFDFTLHAREGANEVDVAMADLVAEADGSGKHEIALGVNPGWEAYGGIIRDAWVEIRPAAFIDNVRFGYTLSDDYNRALCRAQVYVDAAGAVPAEVVLTVSHGKSEVARTRKQIDLRGGANEAELSCEVGDPALWSPDTPNLYTLSVALRTRQGEDQWSCRTGFREIRTRGSEFLLNREPLVLKGVCRHDMWKEQGFTLTATQMMEDMRMIKELGCNFVRLVHYPHHRHIVELADELGLLVSEEPGYWNMDFTTMPRGMIELGYTVMERTIRRDWNSPSVFAWLLANECTLTVDYLRDGKAMCRKLDPIGRLVSAANSMPKEKAKLIFERAGMDFFDQHPYTFRLDDFKEEAEYDGGTKPLTFTEWGGKAIGQSQVIMQNTIDRMLDLIETNQLAGHVFWSWQDMRQYSRIDEEMRDGVLESGVVTEGREPREVVYFELARLYEGRQQASSSDTRPRVLPLRWQPASTGAEFAPLDLQSLADSESGKKSWAALESSMAQYWPKTDMARQQWQRTGSILRLWQGPEVEINGIPFRSPIVDGYVRPVVLSQKVPEFSVSVARSCARLHILGQVTLPVGYPVSGHRGEVVANYELAYGNGTQRTLPVRNGIEVAQANLIDNATRINPVATQAQPALKFVKDIVREQYQVLLWSIAVESHNMASLVCRLNSGQPALAIFGVTAEIAE
ncbi:MAG TPA: glycoside hydrolase family 2 TIM barrel-domain containing protein [Terriglobia bacterium]|nr:glycoside hydrolase family 2 TIM barrel-domain containing protein [Terriglobia bacterium]